MKIKFPKNPPLVTLPPKAELAILLIKAELKNLKFINDLSKKGIDASANLSDFSALIFAIIGFDGRLTDELYEWYLHHQIKLTENIDPMNDKELRKLAFSFYVDLVIKKRESDVRG